MKRVFVIFTGHTVAIYARTENCAFPFHGYNVARDANGDTMNLDVSIQKRYDVGYEIVQKSLNRRDTRFSLAGYNPDTTAAQTVQQLAILNCREKGRLRSNKITPLKNGYCAAVCKKGAFENHFDEWSRVRRPFRFRCSIFNDNIYCSARIAGLATGRRIRAEIFVDSKRFPRYHVKLQRERNPRDLSDGAPEIVSNDVSSTKRPWPDGIGGTKTE